MPPIYMKGCKGVHLEVFMRKERLEIENHTMNVDDGDQFKLENSVITVIDTPGHCINHLCFLLEEKGLETVLFSGDHILGSPTVRH